MPLLLLASAGGAIGAGACSLVNAGCVRCFGPAFPWATVGINVAGSFLMGIVAEFVARRLGGSIEARTFLATGILGGFTTFSAFSLDFAGLMGHREVGLALAYVAASVILSIAALYLGLALARLVLA